MTAIVLRCGGRVSHRDDAIVLDIHRRLISRASIALHLQPQLLTVAVALLAWPGRVVSRAELTDALYGWPIDGGPLTGEKRSDQVLLRLRPKLRAIGVEVVNAWGRGWYAEVLPSAPSHVALRQAA